MVHRWRPAHLIKITGISAWKKMVGISAWKIFEKFNLNLTNLNKNQSLLGRVQTLDFLRTQNTIFSQIYMFSNWQIQI